MKDINQSAAGPHSSGNGPLYWIIALPRFLMERVHPVFYLLAVILGVVLESVPFIDEAVQNLFYVNNDWVVNQCFHDDNRTLFYSGPKKVVMYGWIAAAAGFAYALWQNRKKPGSGTLLRPCLLIALCIGGIPLFINFFKWATGVYCPEDLSIYGGDQPYLGFLGALIFEGGTAGGRCFPAAHCSGAFAFMALYFLPVRPYLKSALFYAGFAFGWFLAIYQMLRGQHFLSHSLVTMFFALLFIAIMARVLRLAGGRNPVSLVQSNRK